MHPKIVSLVLALAFAAACGGGSSTDSSGSASSGAETDTQSEPIVGGGSDEHGCVHDGGYRWCEREHACVRSWELASQRGFENSAEAFSAFCAGR